MELLVYLCIAILIMIMLFFVITLMYSRKLDRRIQEEEDKAQEEWVKSLNRKQD